MSSLNHKFELAARPVGLCKHTDWKFTESPVPDPAEGELLIQVIYISLDPAMRGWMNAGASYVDQEVVRDGNLVTSRKPDDLPAFMQAIGQAARERRAVPAGAR